MQPSNGLSRLLLLIALLAPIVTATSGDEVGHKLARRLETVLEPPVKEGPPAPTTIKFPKTGTKDAPVDGQDGKPHSGPMIPLDGPPAGSGAGVPPEVGVSGGVPSVDMSKPPPITGEHEIVGLEGQEGVRKEDSKSDLDPESNLSKSVTTDPSTKKEDDHDHDHHDYDDKHDDDDDETRGPPLKFKEEDDEEISGTINSPWHSFTLSFIMILFSEIGDKTFLIAALMAMKHPRVVVFTAALASLIVMSILSAVLGHAVPTLISRKYTSFLAGSLFLVFGARMIKEGLKMEKGTSGVQEEMKEVEQELQEKEAEIKSRNGSDLRDLEEGGRHRGGNAFHRSTSSPSPSDSDDDSFKPRRKGKKGGSGSFLEGIQNLAGLVLSPAWVQTFVMTFLGEWGDRSQIATIAMAAGQDYWWVTLGTIAGHSLCTAGAVIGGRYLAEKISVRNVTLGGAGAFLVFGVIYVVESLYL